MDPGQPSLDPNARQRRNNRGVLALVLGGVGIAAKFAVGHNEIATPSGQIYVSDGPMQTAMIGIAVLGGIAVVYGLVLLLTAPPQK